MGHYVSCNIHYETCRNNIGNINTKLLQHISERPIFKTLMLNYCNIGWSVQFFFKIPDVGTVPLPFPQFVLPQYLQMSLHSYSSEDPEDEHNNDHKIERFHTTQDGNGRKTPKGPCCFKTRDSRTPGSKRALPGSNT